MLIWNHIFQINRKRVLSQVRVQLDKRSSFFFKQHSGFEYQRKELCLFRFKRLLDNIYLLDTKLFIVLQLDFIRYPRKTIQAFSQKNSILRQIFQASSTTSQKLEEVTLFYHCAKLLLQSIEKLVKPFWIQQPLHCT